jgi:hypothetical protein
MTSAHAHAAECIGVTMPDSVQAGEKTLTLNGMGVRLATFLKIKVYVAGLYLQDRSADPQAIIATDQPRDLVLHFVRDVGAGDIKEALQDGFSKNAGARLPALQSRLSELETMMTDFESGQTLTFSYRPDKGTSVLIDGSPKGTIEGGDFASALVAVWLGEPPNQEIKAGLLGSECA